MGARRGSGGRKRPPASTTSEPTSEYPAPQARQCASGHERKVLRIQRGGSRQGPASCRRRLALAPAATATLLGADWNARLGSPLASSAPSNALLVEAATPQRGRSATPVTPGIAPATLDPRTREAPATPQRRSSDAPAAPQRGRSRDTAWPSGVVTTHQRLSDAPAMSQRRPSDVPATSMATINAAGHREQERGGRRARRRGPFPQFETPFMMKSRVLDGVGPRAKGLSGPRSALCPHGCAGQGGEGAKHRLCAKTC